MSDGTKSDTKPTGPARIRIARLWCNEGTSLPGTPLGGGTVQVVDCAPQLAPGRPWWEAVYIPSQLVYELTWHRDEKSPAESYFVEKACISHWKPL